MPGVIYPKLDILGQNSQIWCKNRKKLENICHIRNCWCICVKLCKAVDRKLEKALINYAKLNRSKICKFGAK